MTTPIPDDILEIAIARISADDCYLAAKVDARIKELIAVAGSAKALANFVFKSVNVGPLTKDPSREAALWLMLRRTLENYYTQSLSVTKEPEMEQAVQSSTKAAPAEKSQ